MAFDYSPVLNDAIEIVQEFGRNLTFVELGDTPADPLKPWRGAAAPRSSPKRTFTVPGVLVEPSTLDALGRDDAIQDFVAQSTQIAIVATTENLDDYNEVHDTDGSVWTIQGFSVLKPGPTQLLVYVGLSK